MNVLEKLGYPVHVAHVGGHCRWPWLTADLIIQASDITNTPHLRFRRTISRIRARGRSRQPMVDATYPERDGYRQVNPKTAPGVVKFDNGELQDSSITTGSE